jgi:alkylated DNA repair dioxygenase AlkB
VDRAASRSKSTDIPDVDPSAQGELFTDRALRLPPDMVYELDFLSHAEETQLLGELEALPLREARYKSYTAKRRIASFGWQYDFSSSELSPAPPLPPFLAPLRDKVAQWLSVPAARFVHAVVTEYKPGTALGWHRDIPHFETVGGVSLGSACRMRFRPFPLRKNRREGTVTLDLQPRSIYVLQGQARWRWQHCIPTTRNLRYSITLRTPSARLAFVEDEGSGRSKNTV